MTLKSVGLLSPGDMGHVVGRVLVDRGMPVLTCLEGRSERTRTLAQKAGIQAVPSCAQLVRDADLLLSILVPAEATKVAETVARALQDSGERLVYVDCNAIAPATSRAIGEIIVQAGSTFVDAGIIGPPPTRQGATRFYTSGPDTTAFEALNQCGLDVRVVGEEIGQASGFKMCYAALTKGFFALATELLVAARRLGMYEGLVEEFQLSQALRYASMEAELPRTPPKVGRWIGEMEEIASTFADLGLTPKIHLGAADMYRFVSQTPLAAETPETRDSERTLAQMIEILAQTTERGRDASG